MLIPTSETTSSEAPTTSATTRATTTSASSASQNDLAAEEPDSSDKSTSDEDALLEKDEYLKALLGDGETILDERAENGFYSRMVKNGDELKTYFELPEDTIEHGCLLMGHTMYSLLNSAVNDNYTSVSFIFADNREKPIMMYSANYNGTSWTAPIPMSWINTEYEDMWNSLAAEKATSES